VFDSVPNTSQLIRERVSLAHTPSIWTRIDGCKRYVAGSWRDGLHNGIRWRGAQSRGPSLGKGGRGFRSLGLGLAGISGLAAWGRLFVAESLVTGSASGGALAGALGVGRVGWACGLVANGVGGRVGCVYKGLGIRISWSGAVGTLHTSGVGMKVSGSCDVT
jgi:hypothetical protein